MIETVLAALGLLVGLAGLMGCLRSALGQASLAVTVLALAFAVAATAQFGLPSDVATASDRPIQVARDGYITSNTCRACHPSQYASWHGSWHRTMAEGAK